MGRYAEGTSVSPEKTRAEIESTLRRFKASGFMYGWDDEKGCGQIMFRAQERYVRFVLKHPERKDFYLDARGARRRDGGEAAWEQACRERWRALLLCIKAKLAAVESGVASFEEEFLAHIVLPDGSTVGQRTSGAIAEAYATGKQPQFLLGMEGKG